MAEITFCCTCSSVSVIFKLVLVFGIETEISRDMTLCCLAFIYRRFRATCFLLEIQ
jgi:hypothetical protein